MLGLFSDDESFLTQSFLASITEEYQLDWYTELYYDDCPTCENILYDIEKAPDGGYIMVGEFTDTSIDFNPRTWLVKVDACGDLEWQGCAGPNGMEEFEIRDLKLEIWPNPYPAGSSAPLGVRFPREEVVEKVQIIDGQGRISNSLFLISDSGLNKKLEILKSEMAKGLYSLLITTRDGDVYSGKVLVE